MKKTLYSQFELLALAYRKWRRPEREVIVGEAGRDSKPSERADHEPALPNGYVHIRSAIQALMAAADDLEASAGETGRDSIGALENVHEALARLHKNLPPALGAVQIAS